MMAAANEPDTPQHSREGSETCCQILLMLHRHRHAGLAASDLQVFLGLGRTDLDQALYGLQQRYRVVCTGRGTAARWVLTQFAQETQS